MNFVFSVSSKPILFARKFADELPYKIGGEDAEGKEHRVKQLTRKKGSCAQYRAAEIGEKYLHRADEHHYEYKCAVFRKPGK